MSPTNPVQLVTLQHCAERAAGENSGACVAVGTHRWPPRVRRGKEGCKDWRKLTNSFLWLVSESQQNPWCLFLADAASDH